LGPGYEAGISIDLSASPSDCFVNGWIDFNHDGTWQQADEHIVNNVLLTAGAVHPLTFTVPVAAETGPTFARFRCSVWSGLSPRGPAPDGEVEDYMITTVPLAISLSRISVFVEWRAVFSSTLFVMMLGVTFSLVLQKRRTTT
jgi:hypothetical protein